MSGLEELLHTLGTRKEGDKNIYLLFCGDISKETGESWCPDCVNGKLLGCNSGLPAIIIIHLLYVYIIFNIHIHTVAYRNLKTKRCM